MIQPHGLVFLSWIWPCKPSLPTGKKGVAAATSLIYTFDLSLFEIYPTTDLYLSSENIDMV